MKKILIGMAFAALLACGCQKINDLESRMNTAETNIQSLQSDLAKLQAAVDAKYAVTSFKETEDGFALTLTDGTTINLRNGKDGAPGEPGAPGAPGADGDAFFKSVETADGCIIITLVDGKVFTLPIFDVLSSVTSFVFVPEYNDNLATLHVVDGGTDQALEMNVLISPASAAKAIQDNIKDYTVTILTAGATTRAIDIEEFETFYKFVEGNVLNVIGNVPGVSPDAKFAIKISSATSSIVSEFVGAGKDIYGVKIGDDVYMAGKMKDGKVWMTQNLRYVPEGYTPSADVNNVTAGVYMPVVVNEEHSGAKFGNDEDVLNQGYLYQSEVALGLKVGDIDSVEAAQALEGVQGICPDGWHIPTADDILGLVGKAVSPLVTNEDAPYYDKTKKNATFELLQSDFFNPGAWGAVSILDNTKTSGTLMGWLKASPDQISSGYICGSTYAGVTYNTSNVPESGIKNIQFFGFMPMANNGTFNGSKLSYRIAASVRCVRN